MKYYLLCLTIIVLFITSCTPNTQKVKLVYLRDSKLYTEKIKLDFIDKDGNIYSPYIDSVKFGFLDSVSFKDMNPDRMEIHKTPYILDFSKKIELYSPEYYSVYTVYYINKTIEYYNHLFNGKIDFNSQEWDKKVNILFGDSPFLSNPRTYIFNKYSHPSPSLFAHEIGHRAFWYIEDSLGIKFKGLSITHMGLLEYFTVSFNDSPIVGEDFLPANAYRNAEIIYKYPLDDSFTLRNLLLLLEEYYPVETQNTDSNVSKFIAAFYASYYEYLDKIYDNHRGGMVLASTLWRIRKITGQEITDKLVAETVLNLNTYVDKRIEFIPSSIDTIDWFDVFYGLIQKDNELFNGEHIQTIKEEFARTAYPIDYVNWIN